MIIIHSVLFSPRECVYIYQAKHECLWYKCYVSHCLCSLKAHCRCTRPYELEHWISSIDRLRKFDYGQLHAGSNYALYQLFSNPMEITGSYK